MLLTQLDDNGCSQSVFRVCSDTSCQCVPTTACQKNVVPITLLAFAPPVALSKTKFPYWFWKVPPTQPCKKNCCSHSVLCMCSCTICSKTHVPTVVFQYATTIVCHTPQTPSDKQHASNKQCFETNSKQQAVTNTDIHNR